VGPEHSYLKDTGRVQYLAVEDPEALEGFRVLSVTEGIIPALESAHAVYHAARLAEGLPPDKLVVVCLSGRGDKDIHIVAEALGEGL
jgi:tryptophan synthase beta subunit